MSVAEKAIVSHESHRLSVIGNAIRWKHVAKISEDDYCWECGNNNDKELVKRISSNIINGPLRMVGVEPTVLREKYDENQYWFDFMRGAVFEIEEPEIIPPVKKPKDTVYARVPEECKLLYPKNSDPNQWVLPFFEGKRLTNREFQDVEKSKFINWDTDNEGKPYELSLQISYRRAEIEEWCREHCVHRFHIRSNTKIYFQYKNDLLLARLRF